MRLDRPLSRLSITIGLAVAVVAPIAASGAAGADPVSTLPPASVSQHEVPSYAQAPTGHVLAPRGGAPQFESYTQAPGDVMYQGGGVVSGPTPDPDPADLVYASADDDGTTLSFTAKTEALDNPSTDPNWLNNTYIGWAIDPTFSSSPRYYAYFQLNSDGTYNGELTYAATDTPVSCTVTLAFDSTNGYQASVPTACLPGITTFQWYAYSLYDTYSRAQDPKGAEGYGRSIPDPRTDGGTVYADPVAAPAPSETTSPPGISPGYWLFARDGGVFAFGAADFEGSMGGKTLNAPVVGGTPTLDGKGYWMVASDGGVFAFGDARFYGSMGGKPLNAPIVAIVPLPTGTGYWLIAADGGVFAFGGARWHGSMGGKTLNAPIVGGASSSNGLGYWMVASDGGVFAFGNAAFEGSEGNVVLNRPVVNIALVRHGYLLVAADGGVFAFGGAPFLGSAAALPLVEPIEGIAVTDEDTGYRMVASDGGIFSYGTAGFFGSMGGKHLNQPIVGMASEG
ncbi:MAG: hypothetical protein ABSF84_05220 [Acidimicrobiales bacterium]|jgi:hypothetical protein